MTRGNIALTGVLMAAALLFLFGLEPRRIVIAGDDMTTSSWRYEGPRVPVTISGPGAVGTCAMAVPTGTTTSVFVTQCTASGGTK